MVTVAALITTCAKARLVVSLIATLAPVMASVPDPVIFPARLSVPVSVRVSPAPILSAAPATRLKVPE